MCPFYSTMAISMRLSLILIYLFTAICNVRVMLLFISGHQSFIKISQIPELKFPWKVSGIFPPLCNPSCNPSNLCIDLKISVGWIISSGNINGNVSLGFCQINNNNVVIVNVNVNTFKSKKMVPGLSAAHREDHRILRSWIGNRWSVVWSVWPLKRHWY